MYTQTNIKRQKTVRDTRTSENVDNFPGLGKIEYKPDIVHSVDDSFFYRYYNGTERIHGRAMEDWIKPSVYIGWAFSPKYKYPKRPWNERAQTVDNYKKGIRAAFELCIKLGVKYWSGYDTDLAPTGDTVEETNKNFEQIVELIFDYQQKTGIKPLWIGVDFENVQFRNGAITNSDATVVTFAGHKIKRVLDISNKLNAECILICSIQEGYDTILNTDIARDLKFLAKFYKLIIDYRDKIGFRGQLLLQVSYQDKFVNFRNKKRYCYDIFSTLTFLKQYNLDRYYKLNVKPGHDFNMAKIYNCLGSIEILEEIQQSNAVLLLKTIIENGGIHLGGITIYLPRHDGPFEARDLFEAYIDILDCLGKALRVAVKLVNDVQINKSIQMKYVSFTTGWGAKLSTSDVKLEEFEEAIMKLDENKIELNSQRYEHWSCVLRRYIEAPLI